MGTKIILFGEMSSGLMKQIWNCLAIMTIVMFGGKGGDLQAEEHHPNREARGWQHQEGKLCGYIEAASQDFSQEVKDWSQMGLSNGQ